VELTHLGRSGLVVSGLSLRVVGGGDGLPRKGGAEGAVDLARERGVNLFHAGVAGEETLGRALGPHRDSVVVSTAVQPPTAPHGWLSRRHLIRACEESLRRLKSEWVDLYELPCFDAGTPIEETVAALHDLVASGKVRYVAVSRFDSWQTMKAVGIAEIRGWPRIVASEVRYSLAARDAEFDHFPLGLDEGIGQLARNASSLEGANGALRGAVTRVAGERGVSAEQVSLNWALSNPAVTSVILESQPLASLTDRLGASEWALDDEEMRRLGDASAPRLPYPHWHQIKYASERPVGPGRIALVAHDGEGV
jgi:aryl-alcohol dehydrogenase-like predicted oxidoreductase